MALKDIPKTFEPDSEADLLFAVAQYFCELGFELGEFSFEDQFHIRLGHTTLVTERQKDSRRDSITGRSDLLLTRGGKPIAIAETKSPDHSLTEEDAWQAISYARLLLQIAPYAIVTNGRETRAYDTLAATPTPDLLKTPIDSLWHRSGQLTPSIHLDLRHHAAKTLIGVNPQTLKSFCERQVAQALEDLKGTVYESKFYVPELYLARQEVGRAFNAWLSGDLPCFAVIGDSGVGKTNFMCATAESLLEDSFVLFYSAIRLTDGLLAAFCNDFMWEFHRKRDPAYIVERFDEIAGEHSQTLVIFVDGLDEFIGRQESLKAELIDLVYRTSGTFRAPLYQLQVL